MACLLYVSECDFAGLKTLFTKPTLVWFISCMSPNLASQGANLTKTLFTELTLVWFVSCMCPNVALYRLPICLKLFSQSSHLYGLSPVCVRMCLCRLSIRLNLFSQCSHLYGLSPVCVRIHYIDISLSKDNSVYLPRNNSLLQLATSLATVSALLCSRYLDQWDLLYLDTLSPNSFRSKYSRPLGLSA